MLVAVALLPLALMGLLLTMDRLEQPLRVDKVGADLVEFLDSARPDEVETFVSQGYAPALERYWKRQRVLAVLRRDG